MSDLLINRLAGKRPVKYQAASDSFWEYCKLMNPKFYKDSRPHLRRIADNLQALYEGRIIKLEGETEWTIYSPEEARAIKEKYKEGEYLVCKKLMLNVPPRHGKSYIMSLFTQWMLGKDNENSVITVAYNETLATRFSSNVRDGIDATKLDDKINIFSDVFPKTKIKHGDGSKQIWSLEGRFFNYLGTGFGGTITGIGCRIGIIDDPVKNAEEAFNDRVLENQWAWYTDTFLSRIEEGGIQIVIMTRWSTKDLCGKLLSSEEGAEWFELKMKACLNEEKGVMLCSDLLSFKSYKAKKRLTSPEIHEANYQQKPIDQKGALYGKFKTYDVVDESKFERIISYTDTADEGKDNLCQIIAGVVGRYGYVKDVYYTDDPMEVTEGESARRLDIHDTREAIIESNNGGRGFARNVETKLKKRKNKRCNINWFHQSKNKRTRILVNSANVMDQIIMPEGWEKKWPDFHQAISRYQRKGKNKFDDAPDTLTGIVEVINGDVKLKTKIKFIDKRKFGL